jgi:mannan endo-1,4-beta-mannosidase
VSLAALWVWHFPWQPDRTLTGKTHPLLAARVAAFNRKYAGLR